MRCNTRKDARLRKDFRVSDWLGEVNAEGLFHAGGAVEQGGECFRILAGPRAVISLS